MAELVGTLSAAQALELDALCDDFERHWHRARRRVEAMPVPAGFLPRAAPEVRQALLLCLEELEMDLLGGARLPDIAGLTVETEIGRGGMGVVYRAREGGGRTVAVKLVHGIEQAPFAELAELHHPNLIRLERWGSHQGMPYVVMPLARGGDLRECFAEWTTASRQDWRVAAEVLEKVAHAVGYLHRRGILHRDLKPSNILLAERETLKPLVCDFGLAARVDEQHDGRLIGTPRYMAPEQRSGGPLTAAADVWGLGAILSEWADDSPLRIVCRRCLEEDPRQRYPSADALADDLRRIRTNNGP